MTLNWHREIRLGIVSNVNLVKHFLSLSTLRHLVGLAVDATGCRRLRVDLRHRYDIVGLHWLWLPHVLLSLSRFHAPDTSLIFLGLDVCDLVKHLDVPVELVALGGLNLAQAIAVVGLIPAVHWIRRRR